MSATAMVLAAGRGERMRPLTDARPKPLLEVRGKPLMQWHLEALARGGFHHVVVNTAWLGEQISDRFGARRAFAAPSDTTIAYSHEGADFGGALETAGGIVRALPMLDEVFWGVAGDVFAPAFVFSPETVARFAASGALAHLWLVSNPAHNPNGDFGLSAEGLILNEATRRHTFSAIGLYRTALFAPPYCDIAAGNVKGTRAALAPLLRRAIAEGRVTGELYEGEWVDVGTPARLAQLNATGFPAGA